MAKISELTNMMLGEIAPHIDEILAYMFAEIDNDPTLTLAEKQEAKKQGMSAVTKGAIGGVGTIATAGGVYAKRKAIGEALEKKGQAMHKADTLAREIYESHAGAPATTKVPMGARIGRTLERAGTAMKNFRK